MTTYLDHGATSPLRPEVAAALEEVRSLPLGNPSGSHGPAQRARRLLEEARDEVAALLGHPPGDIVFTSGGTESANLAVLGTLAAAASAGGEWSVVSSAVEHPAVRESCRAAAARPGITWREVSVDFAGRIDLDALAEAVDASTAVVAVMAANNETGVLQPLPAAVGVVRTANPSAAVFTDAVQAAPFVDLAATAAGADLLAVSAHKLGGPVGSGALAVRSSVPISARQYGGGQERTRRSGTPDVTGAVGLATALRLAADGRQEAARRVAALRDRLADGLLRTVDGAHRTVAATVATLPGHLHVCFAGLEREELLVVLGEQGVCASGGSSCASGALEPSHVLAAMGVDVGLARGAIRFTLGADTTEGDVDHALVVVPRAVASLRHDP